LAAGLILVALIALIYAWLPSSIVRDVISIPPTLFVPPVSTP
jgi:hypothetical protein